MRIHEISLNLSRSATAQTKSPVSAFIDEWNTMTEANPINPRLRLLGGAMIRLAPGFHDREHTVDIGDIQSRRAGAGTAAMRAICELADKHVVRLELYAKGYADTPTSVLVKWYEKFGFSYAYDSIDIDDLGDEGVDMWRSPIHAGGIKLTGWPKRNH
jgi:hypothetical protein